jgi:dipeptidyl aminopeptidase/acylaminoacyl peptidase
MGPGRYTSLTWDEKQTKLAFLYDDSAVASPNLAPPPRPAGTPVGAAVPTAPTPAAPAKWRAFVWDRGAKPLATVSSRPVALVANGPTVSLADEVLGPATPGQRPGWTFTGGSLSFSADGTRLYVNTAPKREPSPAAQAGPPRPDDFTVEVWHWKDDRLQPMQKLQAAADQNKTYSAVVHLDTKEFRQLSDETMTVIAPPAGSDWALGRDDRKYRHMTGYMSPVPTDYTLVNVRTGETKPALAAAQLNLSLSPTGKHLLGFDGKDWFTLSIPDGKKVNLTEKLAVKFFNEDDDHPGKPPAAGQPQWTTDGKFVLVNDRYDIWKLAADGSSAENITKIGRPQQIRFTLTRVATEDDAEPVRGVDLSKSHLLQAENLHTRDTGFYRLEPGAQPKLLVMGARRYGVPTRAKNANVYILTVQTFYDFPDYYVTGPDFHELKRVTDINPKVREFNWGKAELIHYSSADGTPLSGILIKPENFDPSKKYPMVVYIYERLSQGLHNFVRPSAGTSINATHYASNGYLVLMPDIAYKVGSPGQSALKCVLPAIQAVVEKGYVKEDGIGIQGHSWGGYQIAYMVTQTNRFKAAIAGAPVSNMISAYDGIRWESGLTRQHQYEWTQSRIGASLWDAPMKYIENSPIFAADRVQTPLLILHNDQDGAVPWYQGIEYYLALRRLGKECYMLNYNGQPHGLTNRGAQRDYTVRMFQFFEHHLKGQPAPEWMDKGVPYLDAAKEKEQWKKLFGAEKK